MSPAGRFQRASAAVVATLFVFAAANALCYGLNRWLDARQERVNPVSRKYGFDLGPFYPGLSHDDIDELLRASWSLPPRYAPFYGRRLAPLASRFVNIAPQGFRTGPEQGPWPPDPARDRVIFFFGGSTAFGMGLPDADAPPATLQALLAARGVERPAVYNFAMPANTSTTERIQFEQLLAEGRVPEVVIFLDGLNDRALSHEPLGTAEVREILDQRTYERPSRLLFKALLQLPLTRTLSRALYAAGLRQSPVTEPPVTDADAFAELVVRRYLANVKMASAVAAAYGIESHFAWQPVPDYAYPPALHAFDDLTKPEYTPKRRVYERMHELRTRGELPSNLIWCADLARDAVRPQYVDVVHYTAEMSRALAGCVGAGVGR